jgi:zinc/manganese transport system ATP-binding protein
MQETMQETTRETMAAIRFDNVTLAYDRHPVVHHLRGEIASGALVAVAGPNGAGKSTLLKAMAGAMVPADGAITRGAAIAQVAYLPQAAEIDRTFPIAVFDMVAMGLWSRTGLFGGIGKSARAKVDAGLAAVGLSGFENRPIGSLSGGQLQRVLFARLLVQDAGLILLDEPFTAIDSKTQSDLLDIVRNWHAEGRTVVAVLHDLETVRAHFPDTLLLAREPVAWGATGEVLTPENLLRARTMAEAADPFASVCERAA